MQWSLHAKEHDGRRPTNRMTRSRVKVKIHVYRRRSGTGGPTEMSNGTRRTRVGQASGMIGRMPHHATSAGIGTGRKRTSSTGTRAIAMNGGMEVEISMTTTQEDKRHTGKQVIRNTKDLKRSEAVQGKTSTTLQHQRSTRSRHDLPTDIAGTLPLDPARIMTKARDGTSIRTQPDPQNQLARYATHPASPLEDVEGHDPVQYHLRIAIDHVQGEGEDTRDQAARHPTDIANADEADRQGRPLQNRAAGKGEGGNMSPRRRLVEALRPSGLRVPKNGIGQNRGNHSNCRLVFGRRITAMAVSETEDLHRQDPDPSRSLCRLLRLAKHPAHQLNSEISPHRHQGRRTMAIRTEVHGYNNRTSTMAKSVRARKPRRRYPRLRQARHIFLISGHRFRCNTPSTKTCWPRLRLK